MKTRRFDIGSGKIRVIRYMTLLLGSDKPPTPIVVLNLMVQG